MIEIVPAILTDDPTEFNRQLTALRSAGATRVHIDIMDGTLVDGFTVSGYQELAARDLGIKLDVHLMVSNPSEHVAHWGRVHGLDRVIAHVEATEDLERLASGCAATGRQFWAAINPDTPLGRLTGLSCHLDGAMFMTIEPGAQGRPFREDVLAKIDLLKAERNLPVMVDGGITPDTAPRCAHAGASILVSGSYVVKSKDRVKALAELRDSIGR